MEAGEVVSVEVFAGGQVPEQCSPESQNEQMLVGQVLKLDPPGWYIRHCRPETWMV